MLLQIDYLKYLDLLSIEDLKGKKMVLDPIRKKKLVLGPEETVRQLVVQYLINEKGVAKNKIAIEKTLEVNNQKKRFDILVYNSELKPLLLVECKAPTVPISDKTMKQIAWYNMALKVDYLVVTNGRATYCCKMDYSNQGFEYLSEIPKC